MPFKWSNCFLDMIWVDRAASESAGLTWAAAQPIHGPLPKNGTQCHIYNILRFSE